MIHLSQINTGPGYRYAPGKSTLIEILQANPGSKIYVSNEPDRIIYQDDVHPHVYAEAYHELYHLIKSVDPTARVFAGSIVQPTEVRLQYLDMVLDHYRDEYDALMPVDGWSIHNFILNEASCAHHNDPNICWGADIPRGVDATDGLRIEIREHSDIEHFKRQIVRFREWMVANGYTNTPVSLSEYGILLPDWFRGSGADFSPEAVNRFMSATFDYMLTTTDSKLGYAPDGDRLIQEFSWYSVNDDYNNGGQYNGNLFNARTRLLSPMGENYAAYTANLDIAPDFFITNLEVSPTLSITNGEVISPSDFTTYTLQATVANSGHAGYPQKALVKFYFDELGEGATVTESNSTQIGEDHFIELSGCGKETIVTTEWMTNLDIVATSEQAVKLRASVEEVRYDFYLPIFHSSD